MTKAGTWKSVATLNDLSDEQLAEARRVEARTSAILYLCDLVVKCNKAHAAVFIEEVIKGGADVRTWGFRDLLIVPAHRLWTKVLQRPLADIVAPLLAVEGTRWMRLKPEAPPHDWFSGAPGVHLRSQPYWVSMGGDIDSLILTPGDELEPVDDLMVGARRWLAARVMGLLSGRPLPATAGELAALLEIEGPLSRDTEIALAALRREQEMEPGPGVPGFRGPDAWFAAPPPR